MLRLLRDSDVWEKHRVLNHNQTTSNLANGRENILATPKKMPKSVSSMVQCGAPQL